jgi:hypothetical protein
VIDSCESAASSSCLDVLEVLICLKMLKVKMFMLPIILGTLNTNFFLCVVRHI